MSFPYTTNWAYGNGWPAGVRQPVLPQMMHTPLPVPMQAPVYNALQALPAAAAANRFFAPAPSYPASNMPEMWTRLGPLIAQSPTLRNQLAQLSQSGWTVQWIESQGCLCDPNKRQIVLNRALPDAVVMQFLAHETRHAFEPRMDAHFYASEVEYASAKMRNEAIAVVNQMQVRSEIFNGTGHDIGYSQTDRAYYENAFDFARWHGNEDRLLQHIQRLMAWEITGLHQRPYWEVFVNYWRNQRGLQSIFVPGELSESQRVQAWAALAGEMNAR